MQIWIVQVQLNLDIASIVTLDPPGITSMRAKYFIKLSQDHCNLGDDKRQQYCLTTFLGLADICLMSPQEFSRDILGVTLQDGPIDLFCPNFNLTSVKTDSTTIEAEISAKIIKLPTPSVLDHLFNQLCPGYSKEPHAALDHIW